MQPVADSPSFLLPLPFSLDLRALQHPELPASELLPAPPNPPPTQVKRGPASKGSVRLNSWKLQIRAHSGGGGPVFASVLGSSGGGVLEEGGRVEKADKNAHYTQALSISFFHLFISVC